MIVPDLNLKVLVIPPDSEKSRKGSDSPIAPDFLEWLSALELKAGAILSFPKEREAKGLSHYQKTDYASKVIVKIGKESGVVVAETGKAASAHDLRRSFGKRWATQVMPAVLMSMMRHENIQTTMQFYVNEVAGQAVDALYKMK